MARSFVVATLVISTLVGGCFHDFDVFDPTGEEGGAHANGMDAGPLDAALAPDADASTPSGDASGCGADCRTEATSCAGTCAQIEQSCEAPCDGGACVQTCVNQETACTSQCVTTCETCTSDEGCIDRTGCKAAAP